MGRGRDAELLLDVDAAAPGTERPVTCATDQGLEAVIAGLAVVFIEWHA
jgi:hypothetical protein